MQHLDAYSTDYFQARDRFLESATDLGMAISSLPLEDVPATCDEDEAQQSTPSIDTAVHRPGDAESTIIVTSGLHGVEGFFGSAVQLALMRHWRTTSLPESVRVVLVHALNPWGFASVRRVDAQNRDLNRNFLLPDEPYRGSPELYRHLDPLLNPTEHRRWDDFWPRAISLIARYGFAGLKQAIAGGQYDFPEGLCFGGSRPAAQVDWLRVQLPLWRGDARRIVHLDFHTGLGRWRTWRFLPGNDFDAEHQRQMTRLFGAKSFIPKATHGGGYAASGGLGRWCRHTDGGDYLYACAEFGTYPSIRMLKAMREENRCHRLACAGKLRRDDARYLSSKEHLKEVFCPADAGWRNHVIDESAQMVQRFAEDLSNPRP